MKVVAGCAAESAASVETDEYTNSWLFSSLRAKHVHALNPSTQDQVAGRLGLYSNV